MDQESLARVQPKDTYQHHTAGGVRSATVPAVPQAGTTHVVQVLPSRCPYCGHTRWRQIAIISEVEAAGASPAGYPVTHTVRQRCLCDHCRGTFTQTSYERRANL